MEMKYKADATHIYSGLQEELINLKNDFIQARDRANRNTIVIDLTNDAGGTSAEAQKRMGGTITQAKENTGMLQESFKSLVDTEAQGAETAKKLKQQSELMRHIGDGVC